MELPFQRSKERSSRYTCSIRIKIDQAPLERLTALNHNILLEYGKEWGVRFSRTKCKIMEYNAPEAGKWVLGNYILEVVEKSWHGNK